MEVLRQGFLLEWNGILIFSLADGEGEAVHGLTLGGLTRGDYFGRNPCFLLITDPSPFFLRFFHRFVIGFRVGCFSCCLVQIHNITLLIGHLHPLPSAGGGVDAQELF